MAVDFNWDEITFSFYKTDNMFVAETDEKGVWKEGEIKPFGNISIHPSAAVLNYGQGLFEGMKALRAADGSINLFRPLENGKRLNNGARRLVMQEYPPEKFVDAVKKVVKANIEYVPPEGKGAMYIRPVLWGTGPVLGVGPSAVTTLLIFVTPVGPYFKGGMKPIKLKISKDYHRAAPRGIGGVKAIGNYSATILPGKIAKSEGFAENIFLNAGDDESVEEVGAANFFAVIDGELHTPELTGSILPGITRDSLITLAKDKFGMTVRERHIPYTDLPKASELFCSGTAAVITPIGSVTIEGKEHVFNNMEVGETTKKLYDMLTGIQTKKEEDPYGWIEPID